MLDGGELWLASDDGRLPLPDAYGKTQAVKKFQTGRAAVAMDRSAVTF
jgi:hypothetical protein